MGSRRPFALVLVGPSWRDQASNVARLPEDFQRGMKARMAVRSRCTEGQLTLGTFSQHVLLGGGLDSFVSRRPDLLSRRHQVWSRPDGAHGPAGPSRR